jgi:hypothetical protein
MSAMVQTLLSLVLAASAVAKTPAAKATPSVVVRAADPDPGPTPVRLSTPDEVAKLCRALEPPERLRAKGDAVAQGEAESRQDADRRAAVVGRYEIVVPASKLAFAPYDGPGRLLELVEPVQVPIADGTAKIWPTEERSLPVELDAAGARRVLDAQRGGTLALGLVFDLPDDASCATGTRGKTRIFTIPVEPVSWRWTDGEAVLARGGATADRPLLTAAQGAKPHVDVGEPIAGPPEARRAVLARASDLEACYAEALRRDPAMDGVLVADLGGPRPAITADSVGDAGLATCVQRVLGPLAPAQGGRLAVPLRFVLDPPGFVRKPPVLDKAEPEATPDGR